MARAENPADVALARELFTEGSRYAEAGNWAAATERYARSLALKRAAITLYSLGISHKNTGKLVEALVNLRAFLSEPSVPATQPYEAPARAAIAEIEPRIGRVRIDSVSRRRSRRGHPARWRVGAARGVRDGPAHRSRRPRSWWAPRRTTTRPASACTSPRAAASR